MSFARFFLAVLLILAFTLNAQGNSQLEYDREYRFLFGDIHEMVPIATAGTSLNKIFQDIYFKGFGPALPGKIRPFAENIWYVYWTYFFSLWPHEFGHWARAQQIGGDFNITGFHPLFPPAEMILPESVPLEEDTLTSIGGFEINIMMKRQTHLDFYQKQYCYADELVHSFIQEIYFPLYAFAIAPADPEDPTTWTDTRGDPVESVLSVYENHSGRPAVREDNTVDPDLVSYYRETIYVNLLWTLLDPMLYRSAKAFAADIKKNSGLTTNPWMLGNERYGWFYSTEFHQSPLGYELYFINYARLRGKLLKLYLKAGNPFKNTSVGLQIPGLIEKGPFTFGVDFDLWDQDIYGSGGGASLSAKYKLCKGFGLTLNLSWKNKGYLIGRRVEESTMILGGINYQFQTQ